MNKKVNTLILLFCLFINVLSLAQKDTTGAQANNPLANMTALNVHNYFVPTLTDAPDESYLNTSWLRFAKPFASGRFLMRASLPLNTVAFPDSLGVIQAQNGLGDINALLTYNFISKPSSTVGLGPIITAPTASSNALGTGKWQAGAAIVAFIIQSPVLQIGGLFTWQASFAGDENRPETNSAIIQPFYFWQLGKGTYLRGSPAWLYNFQNESYSVPMALGIGKVIKVKRTIFNCFVEPQYTMLHNGIQPQLQIFTGINLQFIK